MKRAALALAFLVALTGCQRPERTLIEVHIHPGNPGQQVDGVVDCYKDMLPQNFFVPGNPSLSVSVRCVTQ